MAFQSHQTYRKNPYVFNSINSYPSTQNYHHKNQYSLQKLNNNFIKTENSTIPNYQNLNINKPINQLPNQSKISYARNYKLLLSQVDQSQQLKKQKQRENYRKQLQDQIKADKQRKIKQKQKIQKEQAERERKFYAEIQIKAKQPKNKQQPSYFILRSGQRNRKKNNLTERDLDQSRLTQTKENSKQLFSQPIFPPKIIKRGGYHNQSALDSNTYKNYDQQTIINPQQSRIQNLSSVILSPLKSIQLSQRQQRQIEIIKQRNYQEQRISSIIKLQQKMLKKLDKFKEQIVKINKNLDLQKEVHQIRNILKSKSVKLESWSVKNDPIFENYNDFYRFPQIQNKNLTSGSNRPRRSRVQQVMNLNQRYEKSSRILTEQNPQNQQEYQADERENQKNVKRKREIKLLDKQNDKNYQQKFFQNGEYQEVRIPVILQ